MLIGGSEDEILSKGKVQSKRRYTRYTISRCKVCQTQSAWKSWVPFEKWQIRDVFQGSKWEQQDDMEGS